MKGGVRINMRTEYSDLSGWLKIFVVLGWIVVVFNIIAFLAGFIWGLGY